MNELLILRRESLLSRIATTDIVALGFSPMFKNERASSRIATTDFIRTRR